MQIQREMLETDAKALTDQIWCKLLPVVRQSHCLWNATLCSSMPRMKIPSQKGAH